MYKWLFAFILFPSCMWSQTLDRLQQVLDHQFSEVSMAELQRAQARIDLIETKNGLRLQSAVTNNDYAGLEFGNVWRISTGLTLDFMEGGLLERKHEKESLEIEKQIASSQIERNELNKNYGYLFNYFIYLFNQEKRQLLEQKQMVLGSLINKNYNLYYNHELSFDEILYLQSLSDEADIMIKSMDHLDRLFESLVEVNSIPTLPVRSLPILEISVDSILAHDPFAYLNEELTLKKKRASIQQKLTDQQRLALYYNVGLRPDYTGAERSGFFNSFGVRYSTPLRFNKDEQESLVVAESQRLEALNVDFIFNQNKELLNYILEYDTKLRQYSNFSYKLKKLKEKQRVESAVQKVSTHAVESRRDWKLDIEIINVQYELLDLKQLLYLGMLRIYNKANLQTITPYVHVRSFDESQERFKGARVLKITDSNSDKINNDFVIDYIQKNNFKYALWLGNGPVPTDMKHKFYQKGIKLSTEANDFSIKSIIQVPVAQFSNRGDMELWINEMIQEHGESYLFFEKIEDLLALDSKTLGE